MFFILCCSFSDTFLVVQHHIFISIYSSNKLHKEVMFSSHAGIFVYTVSCINEKMLVRLLYTVTSLNFSCVYGALQLLWGIAVPVSVTFLHFWCHLGKYLLRADDVMHMCFHSLAAPDTLTATTMKTVWNCSISLAQITEIGTHLRRPPVSNSTEGKKIKSALMLFVWPRMKRDCF